MIQRVQITTGTRLHFGPLAVGAAQGRSFGGVGLMVDGPGWEVIVERAADDEVRGSENLLELIGRTRRSSPVAVPPCRVTVVRAAPRHRGLGSGTQLALAVARGLTMLAGETDLSVTELARRTERAWRSAIGTHGFAYGGFLVDAGTITASTPAELQRHGATSNRVGSLACRLPFPAAWRFVLVAPPEESGLSGAAEKEAFGALPSMRTETTGLLCQIALTELLPAVQEEHFVGFCDALDAFGRFVGAYFRPVQGDVFANPRMAQLAAELRTGGIRGIAQTSWGPTIAICRANEAAALRLQADLAGRAGWADCETHVVRALNSGARVVVES
ncbi:MAG: hypothetical protein JNG89_14510 [Planctomycetaceae bacterium]|nr:hypothetical protein [Planctomycetaceae bacterium]